MTHPDLVTPDDATVEIIRGQITLTAPKWFRVKRGWVISHGGKCFIHYPA